MSREQKRKRPIRNFFLGLIAVVLIFLAALFGDFFPGLADLRDSVLEKQAYSESIDTESGAVIPTSANKILIEEDTIYYMGETVSDAELSDKLDSAGGDTVTLIDHYATQRTWDIVYQLVENKGFAIKEEFSR